MSVHHVLKLNTKPEGHDPQLLFHEFGKEMYMCSLMSTYSRRSIVFVPIILITDLVVVVGAVLAATGRNRTVY